MKRGKKLSKNLLLELVHSVAYADTSPADCSNCMLCFYCSMMRKKLEYSDSDCIKILDKYLSEEDNNETL